MSDKNTKDTYEQFCSCKDQESLAEYVVKNYYDVLGEDPTFINTTSCANNPSFCICGPVVIITATHKEWINHCTFKNNTKTCYLEIDSYKKKLLQLRNKPKFEDHPDAKCFVQNQNGDWYKNMETYNVELDIEFGRWSHKANTKGRWAYIQTGKVIGDWKQTFEKAPEKMKNIDLSKSAYIFHELSAGIGVSSVPIEMLWVTKSFIEQKEQDIVELKLKVKALEEDNATQTKLLDRYVSEKIKLGTEIDHLRNYNSDCAKLVEKYIVEAVNLRYQLQMSQKNESNN